MENSLLLAAIRRLIDEGQAVLATAYEAANPRVDYAVGPPKVLQLQAFAKWHAGCHNLLRLLGAVADPWQEAFAAKVNNPGVAKRMLGTLEAIDDAVRHGLLVRVEDLVRAEAFEGLLEQAEYLLGEGYFLPAGVLGRAVLEEHLRAWCAVKGCAPAKPKPTLNDFKDALYRAKHYNASQMKHIDALGAVGNEAAHNLPTLTAVAVERMLRDTCDLLAKHPIAGA